MVKNVYQWTMIVIFAVILAACAPMVQVDAGETPATAPPDSDQAGQPVVIWERSGGIAGICHRLTIESDGRYRFESCAPGETSDPLTGQFTSEEMDPLNDVLDQYSDFEWESKQPVGSADMFFERYTFNGRGNRLAEAATQIEISTLLSGLAARLPEPGGASAEQGAQSSSDNGRSGIRGLALIGPACPGPQRIESPCPDQPHQTTLTIINANGETVAEIGTGTDGKFQVDLPPGSYTVRPPAGKFLPRAEEHTVDVQSGTYTELIIQFDSGIR